MSLSGAGLVTKGALMCYLAPSLRRDCGGINLDPLLTGLTSHNFGSRRPSIISGLKSLLRGKMACDESLSKLSPIMDALERRAGEVGGIEGTNDKRRARDSDTRATPEDPILDEEEADEARSARIKLMALRTLHQQYAETQDPKILAAIRTMLGEEEDDDRSETAASDRARHALDQAHTRYARLNGGGRMPVDVEHAWMQRNLSAGQRVAIAMDSGGPGRSLADLFPDVARLGGASEGTKSLRKELDAMLSRIRAA